MDDDADVDVELLNGIDGREHQVGRFGYCQFTDGFGVVETAQQGEIGVRVLYEELAVVGVAEDVRVQRQRSEGRWGREDVGVLQVQDGWARLVDEQANIEEEVDGSG